MIRKLMLLKKGIDVIRGTTKIKGPSSSPGNKINDKISRTILF